MRSRPLSRFTRFGYASAETGINAVEILLRLYLLSFYTDAVGLDPLWAGLAGFLGLLWDAVTDPLMGTLSDRTRPRLGGRRVYLLWGSVLLAGSLLLLFAPPALESQGARFLWLLGAYMLLNTALTVLSVPYMAMASELTEDRNERSVLFALRFAFGNVGAIVAAGLPGVLLAGAEEGQAQVVAMTRAGLVIGALVLLTSLLAWRATRNAEPEAAAASSQPLIRQLREALRNPAFGPLLGAYVIATFGVSINSTLARYYYLYRLRFTEEQVGLLLATFMLILTLSLVGWVKASERLGKLKPLLWGVSLLGLGTSLTYPFFPAESFWLTLIVAGGVLGACVGSVVLLDSILTDVIDYDQLRSGASRAGVYFGVWRFASKTARAAAFFGTGSVLSAIGFVPNTEQTPEVSEALAWLFGPGVGGFLLLAALLLVRYRFSDAKQRQVKRLLERRLHRLETSPGVSPRAEA
ncbi:MAG: MFS transporter [bacterium]